MEKGRRVADGTAHENLRRGIAAHGDGFGVADGVEGRM